MEWHVNAVAISCSATNISANLLTNEVDCPVYFEEAIVMTIADQKATPDCPGYLVEAFSMTLIS